MGSLSCHCRDQFDGALRRIEIEGTGVLVQLRHHRSAIGFCGRASQRAPDEIADEERKSCQLVAAMLRDLGIESVRLLTDSPAQAERLREADVVIAEVLPPWTAKDGAPSQCSAPSKDEGVTAS